MVRVDVWTVVGGVAAAFVASWMFDVEVLFFLAIVISMGLAAVIGAVLGAIMLAEKLTTRTAVVAVEESGWRDVRPASAPSQQTIA